MIATIANSLNLTVSLTIFKMAELAYILRYSSVRIRRLSNFVYINFVGLIFVVSAPRRPIAVEFCSGRFDYLNNGLLGLGRWLHSTAVWLGIIGDSSDYFSSSSYCFNCSL